MKEFQNWSSMFALVDMVAYFASVEQLDFPELRGKPVAVVNGEAGSAIITASYEARGFGVKTGMRLFEAKDRCPHLICRPSRHRRYSEISHRIMTAIKEQVTDDIEVYSVDECFLDLKPVLKLYGSAANIAKRIRQVVYLASGGLRCTIGISEGKLTAKYAASLKKGGTMIIPPDQIKAIIGRAKVGEICGVGKQIERYLNGRGVYYCRDMAKQPMSILSGRFGNIGKRLYLTCLGHDPEPLCVEEVLPKSMGHSKVLPPNCRHEALIRKTLMHQCDRVGLKLRAHSLKSNCIFVGLRTDMGWIGVKHKPECPDDRTSVFLKLAGEVMAAWQGQPVKRVQIMLTELTESKVHQYTLFEQHAAGAAIDTVEDHINQHFNRQVVFRGSGLSKRLI